MNTRCLTAFALVGLGVLSGCKETVDSQNVKTAGIAAILSATAENDKETRLIATLKVGGDESNTYVDLSGGDRIFASAGDKRVEMQTQDTGVYEAEFATAADGTEFVVDLQRADGDNAPSSRGTLPAPFTLTLADTSASRAADLEVSWTPSGSNDDVRIELNGTCIFLETIDVPGDTGKHTIPANSLKATGSMDQPPPTCDVNIEVTRSRKGTPDSAFDSESSFVLQQVRTGKFTSTP
ncbi:hypothetical protein [Polyangium sp. y55x31]|uniref:hypothetical protein n=1 Tax=Polyangium sp. y55x31 TaxID=3042688 RepID=UPI002482C0C3|nr:hypothetical protein [Polyangium sp. y55x31]MDI1477785.1 hypothetical protein [Polyangium sp. y55x31]